MTWLGVATILSFTFGITLVIIAVVPVSSFNLPNKDYWIAPERAATTRRMIIERMLWFMAGLALFVGHLSHEVLKFNLERGAQLAVWTPLGIFLVFIAVWCGEMFWRFLRVPRATAE
jgi:hypothetical protein